VEWRSIGGWSNKAPFRAPLFLLACFVMGAPAFAQVNSSPGSVQLVVRIPDSITVGNFTFPMTPYFAENNDARLEGLYVSVRWRLQSGQEVQMQSNLETVDGPQSLLGPSEYVTPNLLGLRALSFRSAEGNAPAFLVTSDAVDDRIGRVNLLMGVIVPHRGEFPTVRLSVAVF